MDGVRDHTRRDSDAMVDPGETQIALWLRVRQTPVSGQVFLGKGMALMRITVNTRYDWSPHTSRFTVRMPTSTHDLFTELDVW